MKPSTCFLAVLIVFLTAQGITIAAPFDTGMSQWTQPNGATFTGRAWGDEFFHWGETQNGYRFVQGGDGWYYYAMLNAEGEYAPTTSRVGIDTPPSSSYRLERTQACIAAINQRVAEPRPKPRLRSTPNGSHRNRPRRELKDCLPFCE